MELDDLDVEKSTTPAALGERATPILLRSIPDGLISGKAN